MPLFEFANTAAQFETLVLKAKRKGREAGLLRIKKQMLVERLSGGRKEDRGLIQKADVQQVANARSVSVLL